MRLYLEKGFVILIKKINGRIMIEIPSALLSLLLCFHFHDYFSSDFMVVICSIEVPQASVKKFSLQKNISAIDEGEKTFLERGTQLFRQHIYKRRALLSKRQYISFFGVPPLTFYRIGERINSQSGSQYLKHNLLLTLDFLFNYLTETRACLRFVLNQKTYRDIVDDGIQRLADLDIVRIFYYFLFTI